MRESQLLAEHARTWQSGHFGLKKCIFRRGFIEYVHLHLKHYLHHRRQLHRLEPIRDVRLTGWHRARDSLVARVASCEELARLRTLRIHNRGAHTEVRGHLVTLLESPHLQNLKEFVGCRVNFDKEQRRRFERLPLLQQLTHLTLPRLAPDTNRPGQWLEEHEPVHWRKLRHLNVHLIPATGAATFALAAQPWWGQLESLRLFGARVRFSDHDRSQNIEAEEFAGLLPDGLRRLNLRMGRLIHESREEAAIPLLDGLAALPLTSLALWGVPLPPEHLGKLLSDESACRIDDLLLSEDFRNSQIDAIREAAVPHQLRRLHLEEVYKVDKPVVDALLNSKATSGLRQLTLYGAPSDATSLKTLAVNAPMLQTLLLGYSGIGAEAFAEAFTSGGFPQLNWLETSLSGDASQDPALQVAGSLKHAQSLVGLAIRHRPLDPEAVRQTLREETNVRWGALEEWSEGRNPSLRRSFAPEHWIPTDEGYSALQRWITFEI